MALRFWSILLILTLGLAAACGDDTGTPKPATDAGNNVSDGGDNDAGTDDGGTDEDAGPDVVCGDGLIEGDEVCDGADLGGATCSTEGATAGTLACNDSCDGFDLSGCTSCGDGVVEGDEACDGTELAGASCTDEGFDGGDIACANDCTLDTTECTFVTCGDGVIQGNEECDGTELDGATCAGEGFEGGTIACLDNCTFDTSACFACGDGMLNGTEECDGAQLGGETCTSQGFEGGTIGCTTTCTLDIDACYSCGDDLAEGPEACDGTDLAGETCVTQGFATGTLACDATCGLDTSGCSTCGDDTVNGSDVCDGTDLAGETCVTQGFATGTLGCQAGCGDFDTSGCSTCGDNTVNGSDVCDGTDLAGETCLTQGFDAGTLACGAACGFDTSACIDYPAPVAGEFYITELMYDPTAISDSDGEYIEFFHAGTATAALGDCEFRDASNTYDVPAGTNVAAGTYFTIASSASPGFTPDLDDLSFGLNNGGDTVSVWCPDSTGTLVELDSVAYDDGPNFPDASGASLTFDGDLTGAIETLNDTGSNWCLGRTSFGSGDLGSPGTANLGCTFCGNDVIDGSDVCDGTDLAGETCGTQGFDGGTLGCATTCDSFDTSACFNVNPPAPGEVLISEIMYAPTNDASDEYVELFNTTGSILDLSDCELSNLAGTYQFPANTELAANARFTLANSASPGFTPDLGDSTLDLDNTGDMLSLTCPDGGGTQQTVDMVDFTLVSFPDAAAASLQFDADAPTFDATTNDDGANWCATPATELLSTGDYGTPGAANVSCAIVTYTVGFCEVQFPTTITETENVDTTVFGRVYIAGLTDQSTSNDPAPTVVAQVGYGPDGSDPDGNTGWSWTDAAPNPGYDGTTSGQANDDEYEADLTTPAAANSPYDYAYRFSGDGGATWLYCDTNGVTSDGSLTYDAVDAGQLVSNPAPVPTGLYFSEYFEGSSNNKALEIYNGDSASADLSSCQLNLFFNGSTTASVIPLTGQLAAGATYTVCNSSIDTALLPAGISCDQLGSLNFNGDDAVSLSCGATALDHIGQIGVDPGSAWSANGVSTQNATMRRACSVTSGDTDGSDAFDPSVEWEAAPNDDFSDFGQRICSFGLTSAPGASIPDNDPVGVSDTITFTRSCNVGSVEVDMDITHDFIGDLELTLTAPGGAAVVLHDRSGGLGTSIVGTYPTTRTPDNPLTPFTGVDSAGAWTLTVTDNANNDVGTLNSWGVTINCS